MVDDDVCYRHPERQSWTLCERCGRTICPECQLATPNGVYCPECVRETSGADVTWIPAAEAEAKVKNNVTPIRRSKSRQAPRWWRQLRQNVSSDAGAPVVSLSLVGAIVVVFVANVVSGNLIFGALSAYPGQNPWELWRYFTSALVSPFAGFAWVGLVVSIVFLLLIGPVIERIVGRARFVTVLLASAGVGSAAMVLGGALAYGLTGVLFGLFATFFVIARSSGASTTQVIVMLVVNVLITLVLNPVFIFMVVGGLIGGGGAAWLFSFHDNRGTRNVATPYWQVAGGVGVMILLAVLRSALVP